MSRNRFAIPLVLIAAAVAHSSRTASADEVPRLRTAAEQRTRFTLPPGFEIQLVVAEPDIGQPMNLSFDARGRLWITHSVEYPFPARGTGVEPRSRQFQGIGEHPSRDRLSVVEIGGDGKAARITHFADGLNIPIGQTPLADGSSALVYGIPSIFHMRDTDGDGRADERRELYGRFGNVDTHGMANSFTRWIDGWIYGCHGFSNRSVIKDSAGSVVELVSGNTFRFRDDGSHFERFTAGQVNPFGMTFDPFGNLFDADCHSRPLYLLLRGAQYPHFGSAPDGLGFGPTMIDHNHGSTGICGPAYYAAKQFPAPYRDNIFLCNPVTGRVHRNSLRRNGSTYQCDRRPDFITCGDPAFRPVDLLVGPDGALYLADFYNPIIGHYESPLNHPQRDRTHGRVWRIVWRGIEGEIVPQTPPDLTRLSPAQLVERLADADLLVRTLATNYLIDSHPQAAPAVIRQGMAERREPSVRAHGLWVLERLGELEAGRVDQLAEDIDPLVRVHLVKMLAERRSWSPQHFEIVRRALVDADGFVRRAAADALERHLSPENVLPLLLAWEAAPREDTHLVHTLRMALRSHVRDEAIAARMATSRLEKRHGARLVEIAAAAESAAVAPLLLEHAAPATVPDAVLLRAAAQIARYGTAEQLSRLTEVPPLWFADDDSRQFQIVSAICDGLSRKGTALREQPALSNWFGRLAPRLLAAEASDAAIWKNHPVPGLSESESPWGVRQRPSADGRGDALFWDSIVKGERLTGIFRSRPFEIPASFSFWMCGHNGAPGTSEEPVNHVRLVMSRTGEVLAREFPPRNDTARRYSWSLGEHAGQTAVVEIVDAHRGNGYAWIGVGRFDPPVLRVPASAPEYDVRRLIELIAEFGVASAAPQLFELANQLQQPAAHRIAAFRTLDRLDEGQRLAPLLARVLKDGTEPAEVRAQAAQILADADDPDSRSRLVAAMALAPAGLQRDIATALCRQPAGVAAILDAVAAGKASPRLLKDPALSELLATLGGKAAQERVMQLTRGLPDPNDEIAKLIARHQEVFSEAGAAPEKGRVLFTRHCAACHRIGTEGGVIGPQLDGIGNRGVERLLEDVLDPNRNVNAAFHTSILVTVDGKILTGLKRRREGRLIVLADRDGKERSISLDDIEEERDSPLSLMPANVADLLKDEELRDLLAYLLEQRQRD